MEEGPLPLAWMDGLKDRMIRMEEVDKVMIGCIPLVLLVRLKWSLRNTRSRPQQKGGKRQVLAGDVVWMERSLDQLEVLRRIVVLHHYFVSLLFSRTMLWGV